MKIEEDEQNKMAQFISNIIPKDAQELVPMLNEVMSTFLI